MITMRKRILKKRKYQKILGKILRRLMRKRKYKRIETKK